MASTRAQRIFWSKRYQNEKGVYVAPYFLSYEVCKDAWVIVHAHNKLKVSANEKFKTREAAIEYAKMLHVINGSKFEVVVDF